MVDQLHETATIDDVLWAELAEEFEAEQLIELLVLTGFYHMVSFTVNALNLAPEAYAQRFP
jgi:alkylhydroperoxidase family enzyme